MLPNATPQEIQRIGYELARAGITGVREGPTRRDAATVALLFDVISRNVNPEHGLRKPTTFQWEFTDPDIETWHVTVDNGSSAAASGPASAADLRLCVAYQDWVDIVAGRLDARRAFITGRLRPRGNPLLLARMARVFAAR
jgi:putative sterol carrier protein